MSENQQAHGKLFFVKKRCSRKVYFLYHVLIAYSERAAEVGDTTEKESESNQNTGGEMDSDLTGSAQMDTARPQDGSNQQRKEQESKPQKGDKREHDDTLERFAL